MMGRTIGFSQISGTENEEMYVSLIDGYFKIRRGKNECGIEEDVTAGWPSTKNLVIEGFFTSIKPYYVVVV
ncbi:hypothetical protein JHK87_050207 [Glycine soja]|nr:hypothetical protein JHK87_050207 [Glycine soja]